MIFLSFRGGDTGDLARALYKELSDYYTRDLVYFFYDHPNPGRDYYDKIHQAVIQSRVIVPLVGPDWLTIGHARRWLEDPAEIVRFELESGFEHKKPSVPVLVNGARLPSSSDIPSKVSRLSRLEAIPLSSARWDEDVRRLVVAIDRQFGIGEARSDSEFTPVYAKAKWYGGRFRIRPHQRLPLRHGERIVLQKVSGELLRTEAFLEGSPRQRYFGGIILTSSRLLLIILGTNSQEIKSYEEQQRDSESWSLPYELITSVLFERQNTGVRLKYGAADGKKHRLDLSDITPKAGAERVAGLLEGFSPNLRRPVLRRFLNI